MSRASQYTNNRSYKVSNHHANIESLTTIELQGMLSLLVISIPPIPALFQGIRQTKISILG